MHANTFRNHIYQVAFPLEKVHVTHELIDSCLCIASKILFVRRFDLVFFGVISSVLGVLGGLSQMLSMNFTACHVAFVHYNAR